MGWWSAHCNALEDGSTWTASRHLRGMDVQSELEKSWSRQENVKVATPEEASKKANTVRAPTVLEDIE